MCEHSELMKKKIRDGGAGKGGYGCAILMARQGPGFLASLHLWAEGALRGGSRRLGAGITIAGTCLCLVLLFVVTNHSPAQWSLSNLCKPPPQASSKQQIMPIRVAGASSATLIGPTNISHIAFGIAASSRFWEIRKEYIKLWWKPDKMRGFVWLEKELNYTIEDERTLPAQKVSSDTAKFKYTNKVGMRSAIRISRVVSETYRLNLPDVRWFVMGDDDTVFVTENLAKVLAKYDHRQFYYIGASSESHTQNLAFSYNMAFGGGGFAISYPLAKALSRVQDDCLNRHPSLFGSDDRIHACMVELGVPLTKEAGFHQFDIRGNAFGILAAHPVAAAVSLHHMDVMDPVFPGKSKIEALKHLQQSAEKDPAYFLQQSMCYDKKRKWSISVSWGYAVQIYRGFVPSQELEVPVRTFYNWNRRADYTALSFNSRAFSRHPCHKPLILYMQNITASSSSPAAAAAQQQAPELVESLYFKDIASVTECRWRMPSPASIEYVQVVRHRDDNMWSKAARRKCCHVARKSPSTALRIDVRDCMAEETPTAF